MSKEPRSASFWTNFAWVAGAHGLIITSVVLGSFWTPAPPQAAQFIELVPPGSLVKGQPQASRRIQQPAASKPSPQAQATASRTKPPALKAQPQPKITKRSKKKKTAPVQNKSQKYAKTKKQAKPKHPKVKVNLKEVARNKTTKPIKKTSPNKEPSLESLAASAKTLTEQLRTQLNQAGVSNANDTGLSGSQSGTENQNADYYNLIRNEMFNAWDAPRHLLGKGLSTRVDIIVEEDGTISNIKIVGPSGNDDHDASAIRAANKVGQLTKPRPEGMPERVSINFKLDA